MSLPGGKASWPLLARLAGREARLGAWVLERGAASSFVYEFLRFGIKLGWACLFGGLLLGQVLPPPA